MVCVCVCVLGVWDISYTERLGSLERLLRVVVPLDRRGGRRDHPQDPLKQPRADGAEDGD